MEPTQTNRAYGIRLMRMYGVHLKGAFIILTLMSMYVLWLRPFAIEPMEAWIFVVVASCTFFGSTGNQYLNGYGVAHKIDVLLNTDIESKLGALVWGGFAPRVLVDSWKNTFLTYIIVALVGGVFFLISLSPMFYLPLLALSAGRLFGLLLEIYVWLVAGRRLLWFMSEMVLRNRLILAGWKKSSIETAIERAKEKGLLLL